MRRITSAVLSVALTGVGPLAVSGVYAQEEKPAGEKKAGEEGFGGGDADAADTTAYRSARSSAVPHVGHEADGWRGRGPG